jgi:hypothetical protein
MGGVLTAVVWKDKRDIYVLSKGNQPPLQGDLCGDNEHAWKPYVV